MANARRLRIVYDVSMVLFEGFELLDVFGPVELLARLPEEYRIIYVAPDTGPVRSSQGAEIVVPVSLKDAAHSDIVFMPGGPGTRCLVRDQQFLQMLSHVAAPASIVVSVCTGSAVLAAAGLLNGYRATSNKRAFDWASGHGDQGAVDTRPEPLDLLRSGSRHGHDSRVDRSPHGPGSRSDGRP